MKSTIQDVAKRAGVSVSTVSAVINKNKYVSPELVTKVNAAIAELHYHPSRIARALRSRTKTIAFVVPDISNPGYIQALQAVSDVAIQQDYTIIFLECKATSESIAPIARKLIELRVDGVLLPLTSKIARHDIIEELQKHGVHVVGMTGSRSNSAIDCFLWNEVEAGRTLGTYLSRIGHKEIAFICPPRSQAGIRRYEGLCQGMGNQGCHRIDSPVDDAPPGYNAVLHAISYGVTFTALVTFNDAYLSGTLAALVDQGFSVPSDMSLATFGGAHTKSTRPRITTMVMDHRELSTQGVNRLIDRIEGRYTSAPSSVYFLPRLYIGDSCLRVVESRTN